jgi:hypothetical protein
VEIVDRGGARAPHVNDGQKIKLTVVGAMEAGYESWWVELWKWGRCGCVDGC